MLSEIKKYQKEIDFLRRRIQDFATSWSTDDILLRYLKARNFDYDKSEHMLKETLKWRAEYKPDEIKSDGRNSESFSYFSDSDHQCLYFCILNFR